MHPSFDIFYTELITIRPKNEDFFSFGTPSRSKKRLMADGLIKYDDKRANKPVDKKKRKRKNQ